jgi:hypothetical protein
MEAVMNRPLAGALCFMIMAGTSLVAAGPEKNKNGKSEAPHAAAVARETTTTTSRETTVSVTRETVKRDTSTSIHFSTEQVRVIKAYYAPRKSQLPPGLQKKYARTGQLPPGWQKKMEPLPATIERDLPRLPDGYRRGVIDGHAVVYSSRAGTIIDVAVLF